MFDHNYCPFSCSELNIILCKAVFQILNTYVRLPSCRENSSLRSPNLHTKQPDLGQHDYYVAACTVHSFIWRLVHTFQLHVLCLTDVNFPRRCVNVQCYATQRDFIMTNYFVNIYYSVIQRIFIVETYIRKTAHFNFIANSQDGFLVLQFFFMSNCSTNVEKRGPFKIRSTENTTCSFIRNVSWYWSAIRSTSTKNLKLLLQETAVWNWFAPGTTKLLSFESYKYREVWGGDQIIIDETWLS